MTRPLRRILALLAATVAAATALAALAVAPPAQALSSSVVLVEARNGATAGEEWVALANLGDAPVNLSGWSIADYSTAGNRQTPWSFPAGTSLGPDSMLVVERTAGVSGATAAGIAAVPGDSFNLAASSDRLDLADASGTLVDGLAWGSGNSVEGFTIPNPSLASGNSLERTSPTDNDAASDWAKDTTPEPAWPHLPAPGDDTTPPQIATDGLRPRPDATGVAIDAPVTVTYSEAIRFAPGDDGVRITDADGDELGGVTAQASGNTLTITHPLLTPDVRYTVNVVAGAVEDLAGNPAGVLAWGFTTVSLGEPPVAEVELHVIDVGQGDGMYLRLPGDVDIVVDCGVWTGPNVVRNYLDAQGVDDIELLIATHQHADHIGGCANIMQTYDVERIVDNGADIGTATYAQYRNAVDAEVAAGAAYEVAGFQRYTFADVIIELVGPINNNESNPNNSSLVARIDTGDIELMLAGDAETREENQIINRANQLGIDLTADILKVAHHGSSDATSSAWLAAVQPTHGIISAGAGNQFGHPHAQTLNRLDAAGVTVHRTDQVGTIVITTDGSTVAINGEPAPVVPEAPLAIMIPIAAFGAGGLYLATTQRRRVRRRLTGRATTGAT